MIWEKLGKKLTVELEKQDLNVGECREKRYIYKNCDTKKIKNS